ncbi:MAG: hypothetical protein HRT69_12815 [Flavobacteriaceae bacterium]|nr:hypothetical protein [Flavobacteriaceae bacterium]
MSVIELKKMSFAELLALRTFVEEQIEHVSACEGKPSLKEWEHHQSVISQIIVKKTYEYYGIERLR